MKLSDNTVNIQRSGEFNESSFGISEKDSVHIISILRDKLYSNKVLAVVREYTTNAVDAHVDAGIPDTPISVSLPNALASDFVVRDYGYGLSEKDIREVYVMYGKSTKRNSNSVVGQIGVGCKSAFSYVDQFTITSWHHGVKSIYSAYIDETGIGKIALLHSESSVERSGIEIRVPVKHEDYNKFIYEAGNLFKYFDVYPDCSIDKPNEKEIFSIEVDSAKVILKESNFARKQSCVVMGGVPYKSDELLNNLNVDRYNVQVEVYVPIGFVDVSANREYIEQTKHSLNNLEPLIDKINLELYTELKNKIINANTYIDAVKLKNTFIRTSKSKRNINILWKGIKVNSTINIGDTITESQYTGDDKINIKKIHSSINILEKVKSKVIVIDKIENERTINQNIRKYIRFFNLIRHENIILANSIQTYTFLFREQNYKLAEENREQYTLDKKLEKKNNKTSIELIEEKIQYLKLLGFKDVLKYSDIVLTEQQEKEFKERRKKEKAKILVTNTVNEKLLSKHKNKIFVFSSSQYTIKSDNWTEIKDLNQIDPSIKKIYVPIDRFNVYSKSFTSMENMNNNIKMYESFTGKKIFRIFGVKKKYVEKLTSDWIPLEEFIVQELKKISTKINKAWVLDSINRTIANNLRYLADLKEINELDKDSALRIAILSYNKLKKDTKNIRTSAEYYTRENNTRSIARGIIKDFFNNEVNSPKNTLKMSKFKNLICNLSKKYPLLEEYFRQNKKFNYNIEYSCISIANKSEEWIKEDFIPYIKLKDQQKENN